MKFLTFVATSTLLTLATTTSSMAFSATPKQVNQNTQVTQNNAAQSTINLNQAINIAKQKAQGKVKSVDFDRDDFEYEVELATTSTKYEVKIDSRTGAINSQKQERIKAKDTAKYQALNTAKVDLVKAMQIAANSGNGQVVDAEFDIEKGTAVYEVKTVNNGQKYEVIIDANTGRVIQTKRD